MACKSGEASRIGDDDCTGLAVVVWVKGEVIQPVAVLLEQGLAIEVGGGCFELRVQQWVDGPRLGLCCDEEGGVGGDKEDGDEHDGESSWVIWGDRIKRVEQ
jgi:hypothetical protein